MIPRPFPPYDRNAAQAWTTAYVRDLAAALAALNAANRSAAERGTTPVCSDPVIARYYAAIVHLRDTLRAPPKNRHIAAAVDEAETVWIKVWHLYDQIPPTGIQRRR